MCTTKRGEHCKEKNHNAKCDRMEECGQGWYGRRRDLDLMVRIREEKYWAKSTNLKCFEWKKFQ